MKFLVKVLTMFKFIHWFLAYSQTANTGDIILLQLINDSGTFGHSEGIFDMIIIWQYLFVFISINEISPDQKKIKSKQLLNWKDLGLNCIVSEMRIHFFFYKHAPFLAEAERA